MSGENIYQLLGQHQPAPDAAAVPTTASPYTGEYDLHMGEPGKPAYSTFFEKGKEYDGTNVRFYRQRHAVIGRNIAPEVDPKNFLRRGEGIRSIVPPIHEEKVFRNPPVDHGNLGKNAFGGNGGGNGGQGPNGGDNGAGNGPDGLGGAGGNLSGAGGALGGGADGFSRGGAYGQSGTGFGGPFDAEKDFITSNIVEVSNMVPKRRKEQPSYATDRKDFGQVPAYLERVKSEISHEKQFFQNMDQRKLAQKEQVLKHYVFRLSEEEHRHLVAKLKRKLDEKTSAYNKMPMAQDSLMVSKRKGELETSIRDIETALKKLDREVIFVYRDDPVNGQWTKNAALEEAKKYCLEA